jgi:hypothetical protein
LTIKRGNSVTFALKTTTNKSKQKTFSFPEQGIPADILTSLYNFRLGMYGKRLTDAPLVISTLSRGGHSDVILELDTPSGEPTQKIFSACTPLIRETMDADIFDTSGGFLYAFLDSQGRPFKGMIENVLGLGDVRGYLRKTQLLSLSP